MCSPCRIGHQHSVQQGNRQSSWLRAAQEAHLLRYKRNFHSAPRKFLTLLVPWYARVFVGSWYSVRVPKASSLMSKAPFRCWDRYCSETQQTGGRGTKRAGSVRREGTAPRGTTGIT